MVTNLTGQLEFTDPDSTSRAAWFYRAVMK